jgi:crossover junction endodeoxyribonuclease RusA
MTTIVFELEWPDQAVSPNTGAHFMTKHRAKKKIRADTKYAVMEVLRKADHQLPDGVVTLKVLFRPSARSRSDKDNLIATFKAYQDGIADALGIDDRKFDSDFQMAQRQGLRGSVLVTATWPDIPFTEMSGAAAESESK